VVAVEVEVVGVRGGEGDFFFFFYYILISLVERWMRVVLNYELYEKFYGRVGGFLWLTTI